MAGKKFRFPLESVLTLRAQVAEQTLRTLVQAQRARRDQHAQLDALADALDAATEATPAHGTLTPLTLQRHFVHRLELQTQRQKALRALVGLERKEAVAQRAASTARRDEEALRTLRGLQADAHAQAADAADRAFLDEQAVLRHSRKRPD